MGSGAWYEYDREAKDIVSPDRGPVTSELEISDRDLDEVEDALGFTPDEAFDRFDEVDEFSGSEYETVAAARPEGEEVILESVRDVSPHVLAHESVHGMMMQPDVENHLPGDNGFENRVYDEFVARLAEDEVRHLSVSEGMLDDLREARTEYLQTRQEYSGEQLSEEFKSLWEDLEQTDHTLDCQVQKDIDEKLFRYQELREQVLAAEAAKRYREENDPEIRNYIKTDENLYTETVQYIKQVEQDVA
jgi:hypothetical protein